jgi:hypothetical protein
MDPFKIVFDGLDYTNSQNNIFYHMFCVNDALERFERAYLKIKLSGLLYKTNNIFVNCVGQHKNKFGILIKNKPKVNIIIGEHCKDESETLNLLRDFCITNNKIGNILYMHTKGVTSPKNKSKNYWADCMQYFLVEEHEKCLKILETHDNCGVNLRESFYLYHKDIFGKGRVRVPIQQNSQRVASWYAGNFWWATNKYISKLDECKADSRFDSEVRFLFPSSSKFHNLYNPPGPFYKTLVHRKLYTKKKSLI